MGSEVVVTVAPLAIVMESCCVGDVFPALSLAVTPKVLNGLPMGAVGLPLITPAALRVRPGGKLPVALQVYGGLPPLAVNVTEYGIETAPLGNEIVVTVTPGVIATVNRCVACCGLGLLGVSITVTLKLNGLPTAVVGVPLITPFAESRDSPGGSAVADQLYGSNPPVAASVAK